MSETHRYRAEIPPVPPGTPRPLWSVMIPTYNCAGHLREALAGVLAQDPGPEAMQIEVVDDHSERDDPAGVVEELGRGRVVFHRQTQNVGHTENFATCLRRSRGRLVHLLHGDDCVRDGFYARMQRGFRLRPEIGAAFCRQVFIDERGRRLSVADLEQPESGILDNWLERLSLEQRIMTPSIVVRREAYETLGGFDSRLVCAEDWEMWVRIASRYPVWYETEPLAAYRMHSDSNTGRHVRSGEDIRYTREAIEMFTGYLPAEIAGRVAASAKRTYALSALETARSLIEAGDPGGALAQIKEALRCSRSRTVLQRAGRLFATATRSGFRQILRTGRGEHRGR